MTEIFLIFILFLFILAVIVREDFVLTGLYMFVGAYLLGGWWSRKAITSLTYKRSFQDRVFINE